MTMGSLRADPWEISTSAPDNLTQMIHKDRTNRVITWYRHCNRPMWISVFGADHEQSDRDASNVGHGRQLDDPLVDFSYRTHCRDNNVHYSARRDRPRKIGTRYS